MAALNSGDKIFKGGAYGIDRETEAANFARKAVSHASARHKARW